MMMAELPLTMWFLFILITLPMINLAIVSLRSTFILAAAHDAAHAASRCKTFKTALNGSTPSATEAATQKVTDVVSHFTGVKVSTVVTKIVVTNVDSSATTRSTDPLKTTPDTNSNTYSTEVIVTGTVDPLLYYQGDHFGSVPGLSAPITMSCAAQEFCEYPQGLTQ